MPHWISVFSFILNSQITEPNHILKTSFGFDVWVTRGRRDRRLGTSGLTKIPLSELLALGIGENTFEHAKNGKWSGFGTF